MDIHILSVLIFTYSHTQQIFTQRLLSARHCSKHWRHQEYEEQSCTQGRERKWRERGEAMRTFQNGRKLRTGAGQGTGNAGIWQKRAIERTKRENTAWENKNYSQG